MQLKTSITYFVRAEREGEVEQPHGTLSRCRCASPPQDRVTRGHVKHGASIQCPTYLKCNLVNSVLHNRLPVFDSLTWSRFCLVLTPRS